jgi:hypothetical protein
LAEGWLEGGFAFIFVFFDKGPSLVGRFLRFV